MAKTQKITPFFWFDQQAEEAARFYTSIFPHSEINRTVRQGDTVLTVDFTLHGQRFAALNGGPRFTFNPSLSLFVACASTEELQKVWNALLEGGTVLMPLNRYDWSEQYGWLQDKFGLSWQIMLGDFDHSDQKIMPSLLFTGPQRGRGTAAVQFYTSLFEPASIKEMFQYKAGEAGPEGSLQFAAFELLGESFSAMDNPMAEPNFTFNEAFSLVVHCENQEEVDDYWQKLTADGGEESMCGWLKDKFGLSWQIIPDALPRLLSDPDPAVAQRAMNAMLQMRKIDIDKLTAEPEKLIVTVQTLVDAPVEKAWRCWTEPEHIVHWNHASDDWHSPKAENDLRVGGSFSYTMAAKDGSVSFDFKGVYTDVRAFQLLKYTLEDGRKVAVHFENAGGQTQVTESFETENIHPAEMQRAGWQAILDNFKKYAEDAGTH